MRVRKIRGGKLMISRGTRIGTDLEVKVVRLADGRYQVEKWRRRPQGATHWRSVREEEGRILTAQQLQLPVLESA
jgi:hypothetical protein